MSNRSIVIVVGAGASKEFGLPTGDQLKDQIQDFGKLHFSGRRAVTSDDLLFESFRFLSQSRIGNASQAEDLARAADFISYNMPNAPSIDNFLHTHSQDQDVTDAGKLLIARSILSAEEQSTLYVTEPLKYRSIEFNRGVPAGSNSFDPPPPKSSWLGELFRMLVAQRDFAGFIEAIARITFISFNYDRCIKQYILHAARDYFGLDQENIERLADTISVIHPYGSIGELQISGQMIGGYGDEVHPENLIEISKGIRTFTEGSDSTFRSSLLERISKDTIILFLGFGFLPLNMKLLFEGEKLEAARIIGTTLGLPSESPKMIESELRHVFNNRHGDGTTSTLSSHQLELVGSTCANLVWNYSRRLQSWLE